jgi:oligoendopeptidase F
MPQYRTEWDLSGFYTGLDDPRLMADIESIVPVIREFAQKFEGRIADASVDTLVEYYAEDARIHDLLQKPGLYLLYVGSLDTQDLEVQKISGALEVASVEASKFTLGLEQEWKTLGRERIEAMAADPRLAEHASDLMDRAMSLKHLLSESEEKALLSKSRALGSDLSMHEELTGSYSFEVEIDGNKSIVTEEEVRAMRSHHDRAVRRESLRSIRAVYNTRQTQIVLARIYTAIVKDSVSDVELRGYASVMEPRNISEQLDNATVNTLLEQTRANSHLMRRYHDLKRRHLGLDKLEVCDTLAPVGSSGRKFSFDESVELHLATMREFDSEFHDFSVMFLEKGRVDAMPRIGKRGGAFACYSKNSPSFVLLNHTGELRDVSTISHEFGHAIHGELSQSRSHTGFDSPLSLAETASIFSETLLSDRLTSLLDADERLFLLDNRLGDIMATIFRQVQYVAFERRAHEAIARGEELTYRDLNIMWRESQTDFVGDSVAYDLPPEEESSWSMIPHIFRSPFYCYAYAFGNILTFSLLSRYRAEGAAFVPAYKAILASGGSKRPKELLAEHGIDIDSPEFYAGAFSEIARQLDAYEALLPR